MQTQTGTSQIHSSLSHDTGQDSQTKSLAMSKSLAQSTASKIWKSRISWRITLSVFLTILAVQASILNFTQQDFENTRLLDLTEKGRSAIAPLLSNQMPPLTNDQASRLISTTKVSGLSIYSPEFELMGAYGEPVIHVIPSQDSLLHSHQTADGASYEVLYRTGELGRPYVVVARLDSSHIAAEVTTYIEQTVLIMLLMSAFVTTVLMIALGHWLLEPILFMRNNLIEATKNPEDPEILDSPYDPDDEVGGAIELVQKLIRQNAAYLGDVKETAENKIHKLAYFDTLTNLPNRVYFLQKLTDYMRINEREQTSRYAVVTIDIDHFKDINDSMGHNVGDTILRSIGKRLRAAMPEKAIVSRTGEDEFAVCMQLTSDVNTAKDLAEKIRGVIRNEPFTVFNEEFQVRCSIGVSTFPDDGNDPDLILKNADIALNRAKEEGRDTIKEYLEDFDKAVQMRFQMMRDLRTALEEDDLTLYFQPQLDIKTEEVIGAEALIRWFKPDNSKEGFQFISPADFIPVAEQSGLIVPIGEWVLRKACETSQLWKEEHDIDIRIAVNVSAAQFLQSDLCSYVAEVIKDTGLEPHKLELEVTESVFMDDIQHTIGTLKELNSLGVELAIDDFGTGYSSLSYLRQFPIDRLKIDQSFIRNALNNVDDAAITKTIIGLGRSLNLKVIAEGVETVDHETFLREQGCDELQGFRYSKPVPADEFIAFVENYNGKLSSFDG